MSSRDKYAPGPAAGAELQQDGEQWALLLVRELRHPPAKVWRALTDPAQLREWAPFDADRNLGGYRVRERGFDTAALLLTFAAFASALVGLATGLRAADGMAGDAAFVELVGKHRNNGVALTAITSLAMAVTVVEWRGWVKRRLRWLRGALLTWATIGVVFAGHGGATLVYRHGAAVAAKTASP